jgi:hypothetical protein
MTDRDFTPRRSIGAECARVGERAVARQCVALLSGQQVSDEFLFVLAGPAARQVLDGREGGKSGYWPKVWATRGLLYAWDDSALDVMVAGASDDSWRVREMTAKVIAARALDDAAETVERLLSDPVPRVQAAAARARNRLMDGARASRVVPGTREMTG